MKLTFNEFVKFAKEGVTEGTIKKIIAVSAPEDLAYTISDLFRLKKSLENLYIDYEYSIPTLKLIYNFEQENNEYGDNVTYYEYCDIFSAANDYLSENDLKEFQKEFYLLDSNGNIQEWINFSEVALYHLDGRKQEAINWLELRINESTNVTVLRDIYNNIVIIDY